MFLLILSILIIFKVYVTAQISIQNIPKENYEIAQYIKKAAFSITWKVPSQWIELEQTKFRKGNYVTINGAQITITSFPGQVGSDLNNINRWRNQLNLPPIKSLKDKNIVTKIKTNEKTIKLITIKNKQKAMSTAIYKNKNETWFFKLTGSTEQVVKNKRDFIKLIKSIKKTK